MLLLFLITLSISNVLAAPKNQNFPDEKIVGGESVNIEDFPYQIQLLADDAYICGGSIISKRYVLTAAHCTKPFEASELTILTGSSFMESDGIVIQVQNIFEHPNYNPEIVDYDITVLELAQDLIFTSSTSPISLPKVNQDIPVGEMAVVTGWGRLGSGGQLPSQLQAVKVPIISWNDCVEAYVHNVITERMFCAGYSTGGKDACQGDSGGPLVVNGVLYGVISWGLECGTAEHPGIYTNVPVLRGFITEITGI